MSNQKLALDIVIMGGGIAGLWLLNRLRAENKAAWLIEKKALGGIQTPASQGIIHGGTKYALTGSLSASAKAIGAMPAYWQQCLAGKGDIDLSAVEVLSTYQYLWSTGSLDSNLAQFFASKIMQSRMLAVKKADYPYLFKDKRFKGKLYQLNEMVLNPISLIETLIKPVQNYCIQGELKRAKVTSQAIEIQLDSTVKIQAKQCILTAGAGNAGLLSKLGLKQPQQQLRPLQMIMLKGNLPALYGHCLGASTTPKVTITSAKVGNKRVWYLGGQIAESGVGVAKKDQIKKAQKILKQVIPWVDTQYCEWDTLNINRAEPIMAGGTKPADIFVEKNGRIITAWPTKLALTPRLYEPVFTALNQDSFNTTIQNELPQPSITLAPWEKSDAFHP